MIRKGQLFDKNISAYQQFMALAAQTCLQDRHFLALANFATKPMLVMGAFHAPINKTNSISHVDLGTRIYFISRGSARTG